MFKNVIIYQLKDSSNRWAAISAYVPKDQADFERVCWINANDKGETINVVDMKDFDTVTGKLLYYNEAGSAVKPVQVQQVTDGEYHFAATIDDAAIIDPANY